jgi:hypothetical protein
MGGLLLALLAAPVGAAPGSDCWPISRRVAGLPPADDGAIVVVVEESVCDAAGTAPAMGYPEAPLATVEELVRWVDGVLKRAPTPIVRVNGAVRVTAGEAAFLDQRVDLVPSACPDIASQGWSAWTAPCCVMDQLPDDTLTVCPLATVGMPLPSRASPLSATHVPLLHALVTLATVDDVPPVALLFRSSQQPIGVWRRRIDHEVIVPPRTITVFDDGFREPPARRSRER